MIQKKAEDSKGMNPNAGKEEYPHFLCMRRMARGIPNTFFLNVPQYPKKVQILSLSLKATCCGRLWNPLHIKGEALHIG